MDTSKQYDDVIRKCRSLFTAKLKDYGASWRIFRLSSLTDQIFIKANRIRTIENTGIQLVEDDILSEFAGILNYSVIALIQNELGTGQDGSLEFSKAAELYDKFVLQAKDLMTKKNHDYSESWRQMRISSITDLILVKILRLKQIEDNSGQVLVSEGADANYLDIINYCVFASIRLTE
ncbi:MAG: DUF1599 domain-containing protein [Bacteroidales bacterium]|jgi:hypothetical protein|nr:DUF1599 domain-containing protein [Bacteroidales bacterium]